MKTFKIRLSKAIIDNDIDHRTYKRTEASLQNLSETSKDAAASDTEEDNDAAIVARYRDFRDARLRKRLVKYLSNAPTVIEFTNDPKSANPDYVYILNVNDDYSQEEGNSLGTMIHEYIVRGTVYDWYKYAGLPVTDTESSLEEMENGILNDLRGKPCTTRPLQPFGPPLTKTPLF